MGFYAIGKKGFVHALDAEKGEAYWCIECMSRLNLRKGAKMSHFYHVRSSPTCRLYSKGEDHLLIQLQVKKFLKDSSVGQEVPIPSIHRIADLFWEEKKIVFEIQCSRILLGEAAKREEDYKKAGLFLVWILDDRVFNKKSLSPSEEFFRKRAAYYITFQRNALSPFIYDQFEILSSQKRLRKGGRLCVDLRFPKNPPSLSAHFPKAIASRASHLCLYFKGDLVDRALLSEENISLKKEMENWEKLEKKLVREKKRSLFFKTAKEWAFSLYDLAIEFLRKKRKNF